MLLIGLTTLLIAIPLYSSTISPILLTRMTSIILLFSAAISFNGLYVQAIASGLGLYSGLFHVTTVTQGMEIFLFVVGAFILLPWAPTAFNQATTAGERSSPVYDTSVPRIAEYPLIILFTTMGASFLISSADLVSMYLSIELQSFAVYILAAIYRNSESATSAGLKYFLLGALSSALILLGSSLIYAYTGLTNFDSLYTLASVADNTDSYLAGFSSAPQSSSVLGAGEVVLGVLIIGVGFLFKVAAAPFHSWAPDVYDGVPTVVTTWLTVMPKISIFVFLLQVFVANGSLERITLVTEDKRNLWQNLLMTTSLLSLIIGTVVGLAQFRLKRLLAFSTISHVGFLLLALSVRSEESITSFLFYLIQYSITNLDVFFVILALGYFMSNRGAVLGKRSSAYAAKGASGGLLLGGATPHQYADISLISQLKGQFYANPLLGLSFAFCLFSMAGIPPLMGFFAKYMVLYSAIENGYYFLSLIGIMASVISAAYYLRIIRVIHFSAGEAGSISNSTPSLEYNNNRALVSDELGKWDISPAITSTHSYVISVLTLFVVLFILSPSLILNSSNLLALSLFTA